MTTITETYDRTWSPVLDGVRADALDCVQANLAVVTDRWAGAGAHLALGATLRFDTEPDVHGRPRVAASVPYRLAEARDLLGLRVAHRWDVDGATLPGLVADNGPLYVVADAFSLEWTPYRGRQHAEHTFLLSTSDNASVTVVDAYHDETPWGPHRPGVWRLRSAELTAMLPRATAMLLRAEPVTSRPGVLAANARAMADALPAIDAYLAVAGTRAADLVVDIWLLGRSRLLHAAWAASRGLPAEPVLAHAQDWLRLAAQSFVAGRRSRDGAVPESVLDELARLLHAEVDLAARLAEAERRSRPDAVLDTVLDVVAAVLRVDPATVLATPTLRDLPNYSSYRLVEVIERVETALDVELTGEDLTPRALTDVHSLCAVFAGRLR